MKHDYICPKCNGYLKVHEKIIFTIKTVKGEHGLILFHPQMGNYKIITHPAMKFKQGEHVDFYCPICHKSLASKISTDLAEIIMIDEKNERSRILFSEIAGEHCTYKVCQDHVEAFGEDSDKYMNYFGETPGY